MCRYCLMTKEDFISQPCSVGPTRTVESYELSVDNIVDGGSYEGVKFSSLFNEPEHFHVCLPGLPPCLGHGLSEGVVSYDLKLYLDFFVKEKKWLSYQSLNFFISNFVYKGTDSRNKPCEVDEKKKKVSAAKTWCLLLRLLRGWGPNGYRRNSQNSAAECHCRTLVFIISKTEGVRSCFCRRSCLRERNRLGKCCAADSGEKAGGAF
ncbi:hypothetical protein JTE90_003346 [Oedothorax gibbosus]|uniref:Uncharacterized protein n=1 Tax=Oedothorax gibbosus TaxID=931172 RepID=A0AAV6TY17_9ARAC|nr:hypothetical protein JTE90_003346 [Oedothorax gibbosus]